LKSVDSKTQTLFIVGAGFSFYAGLPLTTEFTEALLDLKLKSDKRSEELVQFLRKFVGSTFDHYESAPARYWPTLEDLFTCIDISANSGHHLWSKYAPQALRTARRALIVRTIRMLRERYSKARMDKDARATIGSGSIFPRGAAMSRYPPHCGELRV
jgi:hypothetical protein